MINDLLATKAFRLLLLSQVASWTAEQVSLITLTLATIKFTDSSPAWVGGVLSARFIALGSVVLVSGALADRMARWKVMASADGFRALACASIFVSYFGVKSPWLLVVQAIILGSGEAFFRVAAVATIPDSVDRDALTTANSVLSGSSNIVAIAIPALSAFLSTWVDPQKMFACSAGLFAASGLIASGLRKNPQTLQADSNGSKRSYSAGFRVVLEQPWIMTILIAVSLQSLIIIGPETLLLPLIASDHFGSAQVYGMALSSFCVGSLVGAMAKIRFQRQLQPRVSMALSACLVVMPAALLFATSELILVASYFIAGVCWQPFCVDQVTAIQRGVPAQLLARVLAVDTLASTAARPLGVALASVTVSAYGKSMPLQIACIACILIPCLILLIPVTKPYFEFASAPAPSAE